MNAIGLGLEACEMAMLKCSAIMHLKADVNNKFESWKTSCAGKFDKFMIPHCKSGLKIGFWH